MAEGTVYKTFGWVEVTSEGFSANACKHANYKARYETALRIIDDIEQFVPKSSGKLRASATIEDNEINGETCTISYSRPLTVKAYGGQTLDFSDVAEQVYEGINPVTGGVIQQWTTTGTGPQWFEVGKDLYADDWKEEFTRTWADRFVNYRK